MQGVENLTLCLAKPIKQDTSIIAGFAKTMIKIKK